MQTPQKNTSPIIKQTLDAKKKSRRRLIGSIFLLFIALIILLNITSKVKPVNSPIKVDIKNNSAESNPIIVTSDNTANNINMIESTPTISENVSTEPPITISKTIESQTHHSTIVISNVVNTAPKYVPKYQAHVVTRDSSKESIKKPSPLDILNDTSKNSKQLNTATSDNKIYIQLAAASHKENVIQLQTELTNKGVKTFIQEINTPKGTMYRLRIGPFNNKNNAEHKLAELANQGHTAIITSN